MQEFHGPSSKRPRTKVDPIMKLGTECTGLAISYLTLIEGRAVRGVSKPWSQTVVPHKWCEALGVALRSLNDTTNLLEPIPVRLRKLELRPQNEAQQRQMCWCVPPIAASITSLRSLVFANAFDNLDLSPLTSLVQLEYLAVSNLKRNVPARVNTTNLHGLHRLACLPALRTLDLTECSFLHPDTFSGIGQLTQLRELVLVACHSLKNTTLGLDALKGLTCLEKLNLAETFLKWHQLYALQQFPFLTWLDISENRLGEKEFQVLAGLPSLKLLRVAPFDNGNGNGIGNGGMFDHAVDMYRRAQPSVHLETVQQSNDMP